MYQTTVVYQRQLGIANEIVLNGNEERAWSNPGGREAESPASQGLRNQSDSGMYE